MSKMLIHQLEWTRARNPSQAGSAWPQSWILCGDPVVYMVGHMTGLLRPQGWEMEQTAALGTGDLGQLLWGSMGVHSSSKAPSLVSGANGFKKTR